MITLQPVALPSSMPLSISGIPSAACPTAPSDQPRITFPAPDHIANPCSAEIAKTFSCRLKPCWCRFRPFAGPVAIPSDAQCEDQIVGRKLLPLRQRLVTPQPCLIDI